MYPKVSNTIQMHNLLLSMIEVQLMNHRQNIEKESCHIIQTHRTIAERSEDLVDTRVAICVLLIRSTNRSTVKKATTM